MFSTSHNREDGPRVLAGAESAVDARLHKKSPSLQQTFEPRMTVSHVARLHDVNANPAFKMA